MNSELPKVGDLVRYRPWNDSEYHMIGLVQRVQEPDPRAPSGSIQIFWLAEVGREPDPIEPLRIGKQETLEKIHPGTVLVLCGEYYGLCLGSSVDTVGRTCRKICWFHFPKRSDLSFFSNVWLLSDLQGRAKVGELVIIPPGENPNEFAPFGRANNC